MRSKIIVTVKRGIITSIHATPDLIKTDVVVVDYDNIEADTEAPVDGYDFVKLAESQIKNKDVVEIY